MEVKIATRTSAEIELEIGSLEHSYAECLQAGQSARELNKIWQRIRELQSELRKKSEDINHIHPAV